MLGKLLNVGSCGLVIPIVLSLLAYGLAEKNNRLLLRQEAVPEERQQEYNRTYYPLFWTMTFLTFLLVAGCHKTVDQVKISAILFVVGGLFWSNLLMFAVSSVGAGNDLKRFLEEKDLGDGSKSFVL